ncbi:hypothetical protein F5Y15DRAFT_419627 [Xylariaceae sp. FL0016]|nr:hypothetical protein F5Y15DRAFT_419627 [Xylariaceae sp. FL0016]
MAAHHARAMSPSPSSATKTTLDFGVTRASWLKAFALLVTLWAVAAWLKFPQTAHETFNPSVLTDDDGGLAIPTPDDIDDAEALFASTTPDAEIHTDPETQPSDTDRNSSPPTTEAEAEAPIPPPNPKHTDRAAVIIENRPLENLVPLLLHFHSVLGPRWPVLLYTTPSTAATLLASCAFARAVRDGDVEIRYLLPTHAFATHHAVSLFLTDAWIWESLAPHRHVLLFQADSIICSASGRHADEFLGWDLIGAPIQLAYGQGFNGGFSLRNREVMLEVIARYSYANDSSAPDAPNYLMYEDQWFYTKMLRMQLEMGEDLGPKMPDEATALEFSVETIWANRPLGFHQAARFNPERMPTIMAWCPEVGMASGKSFFDY